MQNRRMYVQILLPIAFKYVILVRHLGPMPCFESVTVVSSNRAAEISIFTLSGQFHSRLLNCTTIILHHVCDTL